MMEILPKQMSPRVDQMIEGELEKRITERLFKNDSEANVKRKLFQDKNQEGEENRFKAIYGERLKKLTQADEEIKRIKDEKDEKMRQGIDAQIKEDMEKKAKDEEQKRLKRQWQEDQQREAAKKLKEQEMEKQKDEQSRKVEELERQLVEERQRRRDAKQMERNPSRRGR